MCCRDVDALCVCDAAPSNVPLSQRYNQLKSWSRHMSTSVLSTCMTMSMGRYQRVYYCVSLVIQWCFTAYLAYGMVEFLWCAIEYICWRSERVRRKWHFVISMTTGSPEGDSMLWLNNWIVVHCKFCLWYCPYRAHEWFMSQVKSLRLSIYTHYEYINAMARSVYSWLLEIVVVVTSI